MRLSRLSAPLLAVSLVLLAAACKGDGGGPAESNDKDSGPADTGPSSSGAIAPDTFLTFEGQRYELRDILQADLISDEFTEVGLARETDQDCDGYDCVVTQGSLKVYTRAGNDAAVYTYSPAVDGEGEEGDTPATWARWQAAD